MANAFSQSLDDAALHIWRVRCVHQRLVDIRRLLAEVDRMIDTLEAMNLRQEKVTPAPIRVRLLGLAARFDVERRPQRWRRVQYALDGLFEVQEPILVACLTIKKAHAELVALRAVESGQFDAREEGAQR